MTPFAGAHVHDLNPGPEEPAPAVDIATTQSYLSVPADVRYVAPVRLAAASLGALSQLTVDNIEDVRLAIDEVCALLIPLASDGATLAAEFASVFRRLRVRVSVSADPAFALQLSPVAWDLLTAVTSALAIERQGEFISVTFVVSSGLDSPRFDQ